jgi:hypothetical protein
VNHKVGKGNQRWNLEWATPSENVTHSYATNRNRTSSVSKLSKKVRCQKVGTAEWLLFDSAKEAARALGLYAGSTRNCCQANARF